VDPTASANWHFSEVLVADIVTRYNQLEVRAEELVTIVTC
jgi:hypothetical protein